MHLRRTARTPHRTVRRSVALAVGGLLLATPVLSSCGFNYATDRVYTPAAGVNDRDASVDVLGAVIVAKQDGAGTFIATFSNNNQDKSNTVESIAGSGDSPAQAGTFSPIKIKPGSLVNLATVGGIPVTGTFELGNFVPLQITLGTGQQVTMTVPVVPDSGDYAGLDTSGESSSSSSPSESPSETSSESPSASPSE